MAGRTRARTNKRSRPAGELLTLLLNNRFVRVYCADVFTTKDRPSKLWLIGPLADTKSTKFGIIAS